MQIRLLRLQLLQEVAHDAYTQSKCIPHHHTSASEQRGAIRKLVMARFQHSVRQRALLH
jgi:hypothetical protein